MLATRPRRPQAVRHKPRQGLRSGRRFVAIAVVLLLAAMFLLAKPVGADRVGANASAAVTGVRAAGGSGGGSLPPTSLYANGDPLGLSPAPIPRG
jgi:hypothetical protein